MTDPEIGADPIELTKLAGTYLRESQRLGDALRTERATLAPPAPDFGRTGAASTLHFANDASTELAELAIGRLVEVVEGDVDRLYRLAFAYHEANLEADFQRPQRGGAIP